MSDILAKLYKKMEGPLADQKEMQEEDFEKRAKMLKNSQETLREDTSLDHNIWAKGMKANDPINPSLSRYNRFGTFEDGTKLYGSNFVEEVPASVLQYSWGEQLRDSKKTKGALIVETADVCEMNGIDVSPEICGSKCECLQECILMNGIMNYDSAKGYSCSTDEGEICFEGSPYGNCGSIQKRSAEPTAKMLDFNPPMDYDKPFKSSYYGSTERYAKDLQVTLSGLANIPEEPIRS